MPTKTMLLALAMAACCSAADASVLFSDNFNESGFVGNPDLLNNYSDRWAHTDYYHALDNNGWTFTGRMLYAVNSDTNDGALSLQEPFAGIGSAAASRTLTGLTAGQQYYVSFLMSGDNIPGQEYQLLMSVDGDNVLTLDGVDAAPGSNSGTTETASFTATSSSAVLTFSEDSHTLASPVIDNLLISDTAPPPPPPAMKLRGIYTNAAGFVETFVVSSASFETSSGYYVFATKNDSQGGDFLALGAVDPGFVVAATGVLGPPGALTYYDIFNPQILPADDRLLAGTYAGLAFGSTLTLTAVPEPASWVTLLAGVAILGGALRTTRRGAADAARQAT